MSPAAGRRSRPTALPTARPWYTTTDVGDGITRITEPHVDPLLQANMWHLRGRDADLLIDTGLGLAPLHPLIEQLFEREPNVVLTHAHLDHMGAAHEFTHCCAHPAEPVEDPLPGSLHTDTLAEIIGLDTASCPEPLPPLLISALPAPDYDPETYRLHTARIARWLHDGDTINLGAQTLNVLHLPGHTPGSIGLYDPHRQALFSGDVVYDDDLLDNIDGANIADYLTTMQRLAEIPIDIVYPGHGPIFTRHRLHQLIQHYIANRAGQPPPGSPTSRRTDRQ